MKITKIITFVVILIALISCEREEAFEGPNLNDLYGEFTVLEDFQSSVASVDFSTGEQVFFTARFSTITDWTITIESSTSNANRVIEGRSKIIDATNSIWAGSASDFPSFGLGLCTATLLVAEDNSEQTKDITITGARVPEGIIVADFESGINPDWTLFKQSGADMTFITSDTGIIPEGNKYFDMGGAVDWDWLIGLVDFPATAYGANGFGLNSNPADLYFNLILRKKEGLSNGVILFQFKEDDDGDGTFTEASEDMYAVEIKGNDLTDDWSVYSIKYTDLKALVNGAPSTPNGNGQHNPDKLHTLSCLFLADPSSGYSQADMDFLIFTEGEALKL
jgi:hypothetical protein